MANNTISEKNILNNVELVTKIVDNYHTNKCSLVLTNVEYIKSRLKFNKDLYLYSTCPFSSSVNLTHNKLKCNPLIAIKYLHKPQWHFSIIKSIPEYPLMYLDATTSTTMTPIEFCNMNNTVGPINSIAKINILRQFEEIIVNMFNAHKTSCYIDLLPLPHTEDVINFLTSTIGYNITKSVNDNHTIRYTVYIDY